MLNVATPKRNRIDSYSKHEALDRAALVAGIFSDYVAGHPFVRRHPKLRPIADDLAERLGAFYQTVGNVVFPTPKQKRKSRRRS
jgi:hypothetical protein